MNFKKYNQIIEEGGAYGHMQNVHEDYYLKFQDIHNMIEQAFTGGITEMKEKTDGQALSVSYRAGRVIFSRNAGHTKNFGKDALKGTQGVKKFFQGHPNPEIEKAFTLAAKDLERGINTLSSAQKNKLFGDGSRWVAIEIIYPGTTNVIPYFQQDGDSKRHLIVLHSYRQFDENGAAMEGDFDEFGRMMAGMLKQKGMDYGDNFQITSMPMLNIATDPGAADGTTKVVDFTARKMEFQAELANIVNSNTELNMDNTIGDYWVSFMTQFITDVVQKNQFAVDGNTIRKVAYRLAYKKLTPAKRPNDYNSQALSKIGDLKNELGVSGAQFRQWLSAFEKGLDFNRAYNQMINPFKVLMLKVGVELADNISNLLTLNPSESVQVIKKAIDEVISQVESSGDESSMMKLQDQLDIIKKIGGLDKIAPTEGITFTYTPDGGEQKIYKFTGSFAPINQILGSIKFGNR